MLYHIGMTSGQQHKTVTVRADRLSDAQEAALAHPSNAGFSLTGAIRAEHEQQTQVDEDEDEDED